MGDIKSHRLLSWFSVFPIIHGLEIKQLNSPTSYRESKNNQYSVAFCLLKPNFFIFPWHWLHSANSVSRVLLHLTHSMFRLIGFVCVCVHLPSVWLNILACLTEKNKLLLNGIIFVVADQLSTGLFQRPDWVISGWETALHVIEGIKKVQAASDGILEYCLPRWDIRRTGNTTTQQVSQQHLL